MSFASIQPVRVVTALGCVLISTVTGCSARSPGIAATPAAATVAPVPGEPIPGVGATRAVWDDAHMPNAAAANAYGDDPSLPEYLAPGGAVYSEVSDQGSGRIQFYSLNLHPLDRFEVLRRVSHELPADATLAWAVVRDQCYRVAFNSPTLQAAGDYMAEVQLQYTQEDGSKASSFDDYNQAVFRLDAAGSPPDREDSCD